MKTIFRKVPVSERLPEKPKPIFRFNRTRTKPKNNMEQVTQENIQTIKTHMANMWGIITAMPSCNTERESFVDEVQRCRMWLSEAEVKLLWMHKYDDFRRNEVLNFIGS